MRTTVMALAVMITAVAAGVEPGHAEGNRPFCTQNPIGSSGFPYCAFDTFEQCRATASGTGAYCISNPWYVEPEKPVRRSKKRKGG